MPRSGDQRDTVFAEIKPMIRYRIASKLGVVEPLVRMQRRADAAAFAPRTERRRAPRRTAPALRSV